MSAPPPPLPASVSTSGYEDGLGRRSLAFDRESGAVLERLVVRPEFVVFERALRERVDRLAAFDDERFARVREVEIDRPARTLTVVSEFVAGHRLADLLEEAAGRTCDVNAAPSVDVALGFLLQVLPALSALHVSGRAAHGAVGPERTAITPAGQVVLLDTIYGAVLERLQFSRQRLWSELRIAAPPSPAPYRLDAASDVAQAALAAVAVTIGRPLGDRDYPDGIRRLLDEAVEIAQLRGSARFATALQRFFERALPLPARRVYSSADDAANAVQDLVTAEMGLDRCRSALAEFVRGADGSDADAAVQDLRNTEDLESAHAPASDALAIDLTDAIASIGGDATRPSDRDSSGEFLLPSEMPEADSVYEIAASASEFASFDPATVIEPPAPAYEPTPEPYLESPPLPAVEAPLATAHEPLAAGDEPVLAAYETVLAAEEPVVAAEELVAADAPVFAPGEPVAALDAPVAEADNPLVAADDSVVITDPVIGEAAPEPAAIVEEEPPAAEQPSIVQDLPAVVPAVAQPAAPPPASKRKGRGRQRGGRGQRDNLRSTDAPKPAPAPPVVVAPAASVPAPPPVAVTPVIPPIRVPVIPPPVAPAPVFTRVPEGLWIPPQPQIPLAPVAAPAVVQPPATVSLRVKAEPPAGYTPPVSHSRSNEFHDAPGRPMFREPERPSSGWPWKLAAAAAILIAVGVTAGRTHLLDRLPPAPGIAVAPEPAPPVETSVAPTGSIAIETQPAGARVLIDGQPAGETPLKVDTVATGRHIVTIITTSTTLKRSVKVEAGKTASIDVPVYSGWIAVFAPIVLDVAENGHSIGSTEQGRLMLPPGRHSLTLSNKELGYSVVRKVDVEAGEEAAVRIEPRGSLNINAVPWAEVYIDGEKVGETPLANFQVPLGTREILFKHPQLGERRVTTIVTASGAAPVSVDFNK